MRRSATLRWLALAFLAQILVARPAAAADFLVFPVKVSLPIDMVVVGMETDRVVKKTLKEKDLVNLALGRPLGTKVDKQTEILAVAATFEPPSQSPLAKLIVFDPSQNGLAQITTVVAQATALDFESASVKGGAQGQGTASAEIQETVLGDPAQNALHATTILGTAAGKASAYVPPGLDLKVSVKGVVVGRVSFTMTAGGQTTTFAGFVVNGKAKASGKVIGLFSE
jgi:hypothetical protein